jgi:chemotaxis protein methyltransferase CheR
MIDVVSTNKTDFFREPVHFEYLSHEFIPEQMEASHGKGYLKIWSAGCSSGEEPYTIAITMAELKEKFPGMEFSILGTDISSRILKAAAEAIYKENRIEGIPLNYKKKYFLRSKDRTNPTVRVNADLRRRITFARLNFMDNSYAVNEMFDVIFCRNVLIYFDRETQEKVINRLCTKLKTNGVFFLGHSESITSMQVPLRQIKPTIFRKI